MPNQAFSMPRSTYNISTHISATYNDTPRTVSGEQRKTSSVPLRRIFGFDAFTYLLLGKYEQDQRRRENISCVNSVQNVNKGSTGDGTCTTDWIWVSATWSVPKPQSIRKQRQMGACNTLFYIVTTYPPPRYLY